ncbi:hypothetical protein RBB77_06730 [Tunturibacter psychrotolerans]|uniref:Uncharacterized protein n=1 Tax=Tunturiibacter psychrotolerans TaxID=3069686 RepID=A0AAU7ZUG3_9BACT
MIDPDTRAAPVSREDAITYDERAAAILNRATCEARSVALRRNCNRIVEEEAAVAVAVFVPLLLRMAPPLVAPKLPEKMLLLTVSVPLLQMAPPLEAPMV